MKPRGETSGRSEEAAAGITNPVSHIQDIQPPLPRAQPGAPSTGWDSVGWFKGSPWDCRAIPAPDSPDFCRKQAPNYLCRFTFNLDACTPLHTNSSAPLLEITYHATDSIPGQSGGSADQNKLRMKISSKSAIAFWKGPSPASPAS